MEVLQKCPVCLGGKFKDFFTCKDNVASGELFTIQECIDCGFLFTNPRPTQDTCGKYYQSDNYVSHTDDKKSFVLFLYRLVRKQNLNWKLGIINHLTKGNKSILDFGCGLGTFLNHCKQNGWKTTGMDISDEVKKIVKNRYGIDVFSNDDIYESDPEKYNIITLWHVLEHVYELDKTILSLKNSLTKDGHILLALPNSNSFDAKKYGKDWDAFDVPRHIHHFNPTTIQKLMARNGMELVEMKPMKYDAYYVSIRSEWHSGNRFLGIIKGFFWGLISNLKAGNQNYSSMLYVFKKTN